MARVNRPASIRTFERLFYLGLATAALNAWTQAANADPLAYRDWSGPRAILLSLAINTGLNLLVLWLIAYRGSNAARWIFIILVALGGLGIVAQIGHALDYGALSLALTFAQLLLCVVEIVLLFRPDARDWFAGIRPVDPQIFR
jgi:hypothetical protein